jgi:protein SCO1/2
VRIVIVLLGAALILAVLLTAIQRKSLPAFEVITVAPDGSGSRELPKLWPIPDFTLTERSGRPVSLADLRGKVWVADLFYATCPGPCPMLTTRVAELQRALGNDP